MSHTKWRWVGHLSMYVKTCERGRIKDFEQRSRVYNEVRINPLFSVDPDDRVIMESQCIYTGYHSLNKPDQCLKVMLWYYFVTFHNQSFNHLKLFDLTSPSKLMTNLKTPWAAGCWGPKLTTRFWISVSPCLFKAESEGNSGK